MKIIDCHLHYFKGTPKELADIIATSPFKQKLLAYQLLNPDTVLIQNYVAKCYKIFLIPFVLPDIDTKSSNEALKEYSNTLKDKAFSFPLLGIENDSFNEYANPLGMKEHFSIHSAFEAGLRNSNYSFLNEKRKALLLHSSDQVRLSYVKYLREKYPNMIIILAHLGVCRKSLFESYKIIDNFCPDLKIYFDISTIFDMELLTYAISKISSERLLFGTDIPYIKEDNGLNVYLKQLEQLSLSDIQMENLLFKNSERLISETY